MTVGVAKRRSLSVILIALSAGTIAATEPSAVPLPSFKVGDAWVFDQTVERGQVAYGATRMAMAIERLEGDTMMVGIKVEGAPTGYEDHVVGADWSLRRVDDGQQTITTRPFTFPMSVGQSWAIDYVDPTRRGAQTSDHVHRVYKVVGWEDITVPAGTFRALKVEARGVDKATLEVAASAVGGSFASGAGGTTVTHTQRGGSGTLTRATYSEFYYVPTIKNYVKSVEEQYDTDNVRLTRQSRALVSFKPAP